MLPLPQQIRTEAISAAIAYLIMVSYKELKSISSLALSSNQHYGDNTIDIYIYSTNLKHFSEHE
jgi:hypothetical protein